MLEYYPSLLEAAVKFRVYSREIMAKHKSKDLTNYHYWRRNICDQTRAWDHTDGERLHYQ